MTVDPETKASNLEDDIRRTQDEIGDTVERLEDELRPPKIVSAIVGDDQRGAVREALHLIRQNPLAASLIAVGVVWLLATTTMRRDERRPQARPPRSDDDFDLRSRSEEPAPLRGERRPFIAGG